MTFRRVTGLVAAALQLLVTVGTAAHAALGPERVPSGLGPAAWVVDANVGDDAARGDAQHPFRTLERARAAVSEWPASGERRVLLRAGEHGSLRLDGADSGGSASEAVVYASWPGERAVISGGFRIPAKDIKVEAHPNRPDAPPVLHVNLAQYGFGPAEYGSVQGTSGKCANQKMEVHLSAVDGPALPLARYPNAFPNGTWRWMNLDKPTGWSPLCNNHSREAPPCSAGGCCASNSSFVSTAGDPRPGSWIAESDPWLHGYFQQDWADTIAKIDHITPATTGFTVQIDHSTPTYGTKPIQSNARWVGLNLLSELDDKVFGEYYLDRNGGDLFMVPPGGASAGSAKKLGLVVSLNATCVNITASNIRFENLEIRFAQGTGSASSALSTYMYLSGLMPMSPRVASDLTRCCGCFAVVLQGDNISVINCTISNQGAVGISVQGSGNTIRDSSIRDVGCAGMSVRSGVRDATLVRGNSQVTSFLPLFFSSSWRNAFCIWESLLFETQIESSSRWLGTHCTASASGSTCIRCAADPSSPSFID